MSDDFRWVRESQFSDVHGILRLFQQQNGFYRPLVAFSFGLNYLFAGARPYAYGATNLGLALLCAILIAVLCRRLRLSRGAAWFAAAVWLLNFHGMNMAVLWISGRTALIVIAAALAAAIALVSERPLASGLLAACALFSKEEAVVLPLMLVSWALLLGERETARGRRRFWILIGILALDLIVYFWLRGHTGAITPGTAPSVYRLTLEPALLLRNIAGVCRPCPVLCGGCDRAGVPAVAAAWGPRADIVDDSVARVVVVDRRLCHHDVSALPIQLVRVPAGRCRGAGRGRDLSGAVAWSASGEPARSIGGGCRHSGVVRAGIHCTEPPLDRLVGILDDDAGLRDAAAERPQRRYLARVRGRRGRQSERAVGVRSPAAGCHLAAGRPAAEGMGRADAGNRTDPVAGAMRGMPAPPLHR